MNINNLSKGRNKGSENIKIKNQLENIKSDYFILKLFIIRNYPSKK